METEGKFRQYTIWYLLISIESFYVISIPKLLESSIPEWILTDIVNELIYRIDWV